MKLLNRWRQLAKKFKTDVYIVYRVSRDARVPWHVRLQAILVAGYALSPVDIIPDFIPVLVYLAIWYWSRSG